MEHIQIETRIEAPVEHVWAFLFDTSRWHDWMPRARVLGLQRAVRPGRDDVRLVDEDDGLRVEDDVHGPRGGAAEAHPRAHRRPGPAWTTIFRFEPEGEATRLIVESDYEMPGHIPGFLKNLMTKSFFERQMRHMLGDFKAFAEATVPRPRLTRSRSPGLGGGLSTRPLRQREPFRRGRVDATPLSHRSAGRGRSVSGTCRAGAAPA